jgi:hypothetical protein
MNFSYKKIEENSPKKGGKSPEEGWKVNQRRVESGPAFPKIVIF